MEKSPFWHRTIEDIGDLYFEISRQNQPGSRSPTVVSIKIASRTQILYLGLCRVNDSVQCLHAGGGETS